MLNIILTIDYEIFGDGAGDVKIHIISPTDKILNICNKFSVPLTIMFEANEYQKFMEYESVLVRDIGYSPAAEMKNQILKAYSAGHDVQLHIHPQWVDAKYKNGKWMMENPNLSITEFSPSKINRIIQEGKKVIESIIREVDNQYSVSAMRLTNLPWVEAPVAVHEAMKNNNIFFHSLSTADSPKNNSKGLWPLDLEEILFEIPIHSVTMKGFRRFTWKRITTALYRKMHTKDSVSINYDKNLQHDNNSLVHKFKNILFAPQDLKWDFCKQNSHEMIKFLKMAFLKYYHADSNVPLIMIGHSKDFFNSRNFESFIAITLNKYGNEHKTKFATMREFCEEQVGI